MIGTHAEWGTVDGWVGAIGTILAFGVALVLLGIEMRERQQDRLSRQSAQARLVHAWITRASIAKGQGFPEDGAFDMRLRIHNGSDEPVWNLQAFPLYPDGGPVGSQRFEQDTLGPGEDVEGGFGAMPVDPSRARPGYRVYLSFTDSAGAHWRRRGPDIIRLGGLRNIPLEEPDG